MRCKCCDKSLSTSESISKDRNGEYFDTCSVCLGVSFMSLKEYDFSVPDRTTIDTE